MGINKDIYTNEDGREINILQDKTNELAEGFMYAVNSDMFEMREPSPEPPKSLLYRIKYFVADKLIDLAQRINREAVYDR